MSGSNDALTQMLLMQARQGNRRPSAQAQLAQQLMAASQQQGPVWGTGPTIARAVPGILGAFLAQQAESSDRAREDAQLQQMQDRQDKTDYRQRQELQAFLGGGAPAMPQQAPQMPIQAPPMASPTVTPTPPNEAGVAGSEARYASVPGRPPVGASYREPEWAAGLPPANGRMNPNLDPNAVQPAGAPPAPQGQPDAMTMYQRAVSSPNPMIRAMAPGFLAQAGREDQRNNRPPVTVSPGSTVIDPNTGRPIFTAPRAPESESSTRGPIPAGYRMNARGELEQIPGAPNQGQFAGTSMDAQSLNILLAPNADPTSPAYAAAYQQAYGPRTVTQADGTIVTIQPQPPQGIRPPVMAQQAPAAPPQAAPMAPPAGAPTVQNTPTAEVIQTPSATVTRTPGTTGHLSEAQSRANMFGNAMSEGHTILQNVQIPSNAALLAWRNAPESVVNMGLSENDQQYFNALRQFAAGVLRKETGAAFSNSELLDVQSRFFPMPGDSLVVRQQKARARQQAIESMRAEIPGGFRGQLPPDQGGQAAPSAGGRVIQYGADGRRVGQ